MLILDNEDVESLVDPIVEFLSEEFVVDSLLESGANTLYAVWDPDVYDPNFFLFFKCGCNTQQNFIVWPILWQA